MVLPSVCVNEGKRIQLYHKSRLILDSRLIKKFFGVKVFNMYNLPSTNSSLPPPPPPPPPPTPSPSLPPSPYPHPPLYKRYLS